MIMTVAWNKEDCTNNRMPTFLSFMKDGTREILGNDVNF